MTPEDAKRFYFQYDGSSFHMDREEPVKFNSFRMLDLEEETLKEWDEELLDSVFNSLWSDPDRVWVVHERIVQIIRRCHCDAETYVNRLLGEMEKMDHLDSFNMTLVIENMAGRTESMNDGGVHAVCKLSSLEKRMNDIIGCLIEACTARHVVDDRFEKAVRRYRGAYAKWSSSAGSGTGACGLASI
ncbi:MAG: hypothetical protein E7003_00030 [Eggerthellaceae bacterium]|nr:hypothetical protein [Eggerthellaceae bacterium]